MTRRIKIGAAISVCFVLAICGLWEARKSTLPSWQQSIDNEILIGQVVRVTSNECVENILLAYEELKGSDCSVKLGFFRYLLKNYLIPIEGDAHGREAVAEMIAFDNCADRFFVEMDSMASDSRINEKQREKIRAWSKAMKDLSHHK